MTGSRRLERIQEVLGYRFQDPSLADAALTHPSYEAEHGGSRSYERLEFLGDSVLGHIVAEELFRRYPDAPEGILTRRKIAVVSGERLSAVAAGLGVGDLMRFGKGEARAGERGRASVLENALEALIGAVYVDGGIDAAHDVVLTVLGDVLSLEDIADTGDPKSALQERTQSTGEGLPEYSVVASEGPAHAPSFTVEVRLGGRVLGSGTGHSKKDAEKAAAAAALELLSAP